MKVNSKLAAVLFVGLILIGCSDAAHSAKRKRRDFSLTISAANTTSVLHGDVRVRVKVRNVSLHTVWAGRWLGPPGVCYTIDVVKDGHPAPITEEYKKILTPSDNWAGSLYFVPIKPFRSQTFEISLERYFDLGAPGKYDVTIAAGSDPGQPDNVDIKSNTITVKILSIEAQ